MSDDGSITVARRLRGKAGVWECLSEGEVVWFLLDLTGVRDGNLGDMMDRLADLIDPTTRAAADGTCERCGAPAEALRDAYCAHCGRRIVRDEEDER